jgi:hypothetical protein
MSANKPKFIDKFWPISTIVASRTGQYKKILAQRMEVSKYLIENNFGVKADKVADTFINAYLASDKDYPAPIESVQNPQSNKDFSLRDQYILFLWNYYVNDKSKKTKIPKEVPPKEQSKSNVLDPSGALTLYEGTKEEDLVNEEIDERILKILGIQDIFDIDYGTYLSLLKEKLVTISMGDKKIPREEQILLQDEFKRVKGKVGRFKVRSKKINADNIGTTGPIRVSKQQYFLAGKVSVPDVSKESANIGSSIKKDIEAIKNSIISIASLLASQNKLIQKDAENQRKIGENLKRGKREEDLEKRDNKLKTLASKVLAPFQSILDKIINFIVWTLLGRLMVKFIDWISDKKNKKKIDTLVRFIGDWWPALLGAFLLFATPLGGFVRSIIGTVTKLTFKLSKFAIPKLLNFVKANPVTAALIGGSIAAGVGAYASTQQVDKTRKENKKSDPSTVLPQETAKTGKGPGAAQLSQEQIQSRGFNMFRGGGLIPKFGDYQKPTPIKNIGFESGGTITDDTGVRIAGAGKDTQLIAAQPGEIVISKPAVDKYGANFFLGLNKSGGGTNVPKMVNNIQLAAGGGMVGALVPEKPSAAAKKSVFNPEVANKKSMMSLNNVVNVASSLDQNKKLTTPTKMFGDTSDTLQNVPTANKKSSQKAPSIKPFSLKPPRTQPNNKPSNLQISNDINSVSIKDAALQSFRPLSQKMPFIVPFINNAMTMISGVGDTLVDLRKRNINIRPNIKQYIPEPPSGRSKSNVITLPPVVKQSTESSGTRMNAIRDVEDFPAFMMSSHRKNNIQIYGIGGIN